MAELPFDTRKKNNMAISETNTATVSSVAASDWVVLKRGVNRCYISCGTWSTTSVDLEISDDAATAYPVDMNGSDVTATANRVLDVTGPGYLRLNATAYAASPVTLKVLNPVDDRL